MKVRDTNKGGAGVGLSSRPASPVTEPANAVRSAQSAIQKDPALPENYAILAGSLRTLAQSLRERDPLRADELLHLACAAAWEAKRQSGRVETSGRTKLEVKTLLAWLRTRNHLAPQEAESLMDRIHSEQLARALDEAIPVSEA